jgi:hypothetical protein
MDPNGAGYHAELRAMPCQMRYLRAPNLVLAEPRWHLDLACVKVNGKLCYLDT